MRVETGAVAPVFLWLSLSDRNLDQPTQWRPRLDPAVTALLLCGLGPAAAAGSVRYLDRQVEMGFRENHRVAMVPGCIARRARYTPGIARPRAIDVEPPEDCFCLPETSLRSHRFAVYGFVTEYRDWPDACVEGESKAVYGREGEKLRRLDWSAFVGIGGLPAPQEALLPVGCRCTVRSLCGRADRTVASGLRRAA